MRINWVTIGDVWLRYRCDCDVGRTRRRLRARLRDRLRLGLLRRPYDGRGFGAG